jgi:hypothetical protein
LPRPLSAASEGRALERQAPVSIDDLAGQVGHRAEDALGGPGQRPEQKVAQERHGDVVAELAGRDRLGEQPVERVGESLLLVGDRVRLVRRERQRAGDPHHQAVLAQDLVGLREDEVPNALQRVGARLARGGDRAQAALQLAIGERDEEDLLGHVMVLEGAEQRPRLAGDVAQRRARVPAAPKHARRGVQDGLLLGIFRGAAAHRGSPLLQRLSGC